MRQSAVDKGGNKSLNLLGALNKGIPTPAPSQSANAVVTQQPAKDKGTAGPPLTDSTDPRRWVIILPILVFFAGLITWAGFAGRRHAS